MEELNMSEFAATDPAQLKELLEQINAMKETFSSLRKIESDRPKKGKTREDLKQLLDADFPLIVLSKPKYTNKKGEIVVSSLRSQFKAMAKEMELDFEPTLVDDGTNLYLVNFDENDAERKFDEYVLRTAGIAASDLYSVAADLDTATN
jgi:hypothetical protein